MSRLSFRAAASDIRPGPREATCGARQPFPVHGSVPTVAGGTTIPRHSNPRHARLAARFESFVAQRDFPCVGAKAALGRGQATYFLGGNLTRPDDDRRLLAALYRFIDLYRRDRAPFTTFVALYARPRGLGEKRFERALWQRLQALHRLDRRHYRWDPRVSSDPASPHFSFSLKSEAFFIVGLHDGASRSGRRFGWPTLVFNPHDQFESLRAEGRFEPLRDAIRGRDAALDGAPNPMVKSYGDDSEARQYSGRHVTADWRCPLHPGAAEGGP